ncbi:MAG: hypothetical protein QM612_11055 [Thermomonas sp.]|uniref:hypothetical protein n=1 Tax=Thermomonas sp. TaxID=1971895 RepID=UPI0039E3B03A
MSWVAIVLIVIGVWVALKVAGALLKLVFWGVALVGVYWLLAPHMGWPQFF